MPSQSENDKLINALLFKKDLNEVHLLIDLVSGRADRSLSILSIPDPDNSSKILTSPEILTRIAQMRYPPTDTDIVNASNATILLMVKDRLSAFADPARASTIAYTYLFIEAESKTLGSHLFRWITRTPNVETSEHISDDTSVGLARTTFPSLQHHAERFNLYRAILSWFTILWLLLTALTLWDASLGRTALEHADQNWRSYIDAARDNPELVNAENDCDVKQLLSRENVPLSTTGTDASGAAVTTTRASDTGRMATACRRIHYRKEMTKQSYDEITITFGCNYWYDFFHPWCWYNVLYGEFEPSNDLNARTPWQLATSKLSVYTSYILPMMFALLGTLIGAFRAILNKVDNSSLAPRDMVGMLVGMPVGLVAGFAVGLFFSPSTLPMQGTDGIGSTFSLAPSGLGFLAGYASQSFFSYIDNLVVTMFPGSRSSTVGATAVAVAAHDALTSTAARTIVSDISTPTIPMPTPIPASTPPDGRSH
jgi:hypothetical protein